MIVGKKHEIDNRVLLAVCDKEYIGKKFENEKIEITISEKFYNGQELDKNELIDLMNESDSINLFGEKCVNIAKEEGLITEKSIIMINNVPHAQVYRM